MSFNDTLANTAQLASLNSQLTHKEEQKNKKNEECLDLQNSFLLKAGEDIELPVVIVLPEEEDAKCTVSYDFSSDKGDVDFSLLHTNSIHDDDGGSIRVAREYSPEMVDNGIGAPKTDPCR